MVHRKPDSPMVERCGEGTTVIGLGETAALLGLRWSRHGFRHQRGGVLRLFKRPAARRRRGPGGGVAFGRVAAGSGAFRASTVAAATRPPGSRDLSPENEGRSVFSFAGAANLDVSHTLRPPQKWPMPKGIMPGPYQLVAIRGEVQVFRADFDDRVEATRALADALVRYPDCEVRLTSGDGVLISAGPAPAP